MSWFLILLDYLDKRAASALATLRPALTCSEEEYAGLLYRLTTMPARPAHPHDGWGAWPDQKAKQDTSTPEHKEDAKSGRRQPGVR